ncbi:MAG: translocation and assembly module TamB [Woeseiaceae bacterium]
MDELIMSLSGSLVEHELAIDLESEFGTIALGASGSLADIQDPNLSAWQGTLAVFDIDIPDTLRASLDQSSRLLLSLGETRLEPACLSSVDGGRLCLGLSWTEPSGAEGNVSLTDISADIPLAMANSDIALTQKLSGDIRLSRNAAGLLDGNASLQISPGQVHSRSDVATSTDTDAGAMGFEIENGNLGAGYFDLPIPGLGVIDIDFSINELGRGVDSHLSGRALIDLTDIGLLANFLPYVDGTSGRLKTNIALTGAVSDPIFTGELTLSDAAIESAEFGTAFTDINIESTMHEDYRLDLDGSFRAGDGIGAIKSSVTYDDLATRGMTLEISGSNLTLIEMPDLLVVANSDLQIGLSSGTLQLGGVVEIPKAMIRPGFNQDLRISESEDVVIVAGELQGHEPETGTSQGLKINGDLRIDLGGDVQIDLGVAQANLTGSVDFEWQDNLMPIASGAYTIDGTIAAVGQVLNISQGTIRFSSVPANNPFLNIRAEREIFGNSQIRTAGVRLSGNAQNPVMEAYTSPATNEERALTLLATGSDFDYEEGVGAIDFGTYIAPRLFLSYGIGVFDQENVISARYDLKKGFGIKATSGQRESGLDVNYRFEN